MGEIVGILLAAGAARRFGGPKLLVPLAGRPLIAWSLAALAPCDRVLAVVRPRDRKMQALLERLGAEPVPNPRAHNGMGSSIAAGVRAAPQAAGWCILPADMPWVPVQATAAVVQALRAGAAIAAPSLDGRRGHPVGFARRFGPELRALQGEQGGRRLLAEHRQSLVLLPLADPGVVRDVDRRHDLVPCLRHRFPRSSGAGSRESLSRRHGGPTPAKACGNLIRAHRSGRCVAG